MIIYKTISQLQSKLQKTIAETAEWFMQLARSYHFQFFVPIDGAAIKKLGQSKILKAVTQSFASHHCFYKNYATPCLLSFAIGY